MVSTRSRGRQAQKANDCNPQNSEELSQPSPQSLEKVKPDTHQSSANISASEHNEQNDGITSTSVCTDVMELPSKFQEMRDEDQDDFEQLNIQCDVSVHDEGNNCSAADTDFPSFEEEEETCDAVDHSCEDLSFKSSGPREQPRDNFGWLVQTGKVITIDPLDTIPLACVREVSKSGVKKLEFTFLRSANGPGMSMGVSSAAPQPVVVKIPQDRLVVVVEYFISVKGLCMENAQAISTSKVWYGIVEGAHRRKALINLGEKVPKIFKGYPWVVMCVEWQPLAVLRAFARERNEFQRGEHLVDFTMYDIFRNLKQSADELALREGLTEGRMTNRGYVKRVADHYCGGKDTANNLTRQLAGIAATLSWRVIEEMGSLLNKEDRTQAKRIAKENGESTLEYIDERVCKNLLSKSTFRGATTFKTIASEEDQISALRRLSFLAPTRRYKPVSKTELETQTKKTIAARKEVDKMKKKLGGHAWPEDMVSVRESLLTTTTLDADVEDNDGNDGLLKPFQDLWERLFPINVEMENAKDETEAQDQASGDSTVANNTSESGVKNVEETDQEASAPEITENGGALKDVQPSKLPVDGEGAGKSQDSTDRDLSTEEHGVHDAIDDAEGDADEVDASKQCPLKQFSLRLENKGWRDFQRDLHSEELFDFIFADPVQSLSAYELKQNQWTEFKDDRRIKEFATFCRVSLRPGCYVFVIVLAEEFGAFRSAFQAEGMKTMKAPCLIIPKPENVRATRLKDLPQDCGELALVAKAPGTCFGFKPNFSRSYSLFESSFTRKIGVIDNVPRCQNPLRGTKSISEVRPRERHPDFVLEVIETFCAPTGTVLDTCGGALTTGISCVSSRRPCVVLEKDKYCFDLAIRRLEKLCRDKLLSPDEGQGTNTEEDEGEESD